jgi:hypothetical protein
MEVKRVFHSLKPTEPRKLHLLYEKDPAQRRFVHTGTYLCAVRAETEKLVSANHNNIKLKTEH